MQDKKCIEKVKAHFLANLTRLICSITRIQFHRGADNCRKIKILTTLMDRMKIDTKIMKSRSAIISISIRHLGPIILRT
jgi:hypothetical protein